MDIEQKQADLIEHFVKQVKSPCGAPVSKAFVDATSHPLLFTFSEFLSLPIVAETSAEFSQLGFSSGIVRGKLNQLRRCSEVQCAAGRDLRPGQLGSMIEILSAWLTTSDNLLLSIQDKIKWADTMGEAYKKHKKEMRTRWKKRSPSRDLPGSWTIKQALIQLGLPFISDAQVIYADMGLLGHEEIHLELDGVTDYKEDQDQPKRRRSS